MTSEMITDRKQSNEKTRPSVITKTLIIIGGIFGIHPLLIIISLPLYLTGVIILWLNKNISRKLKLKWTIYPIICIISVWLIIIISTFIYKKIFL